MTRAKRGAVKPRRLRFAASAIDQLVAAIGFIAGDNPGAAARLTAAIEKRLAQLKRVPLSGRVVPELGDPKRREVIVPPFRIVYRVLAGEVRVLAVVHSRQELARAVPVDDDE